MVNTLSLLSLAGLAVAVSEEPSVVHSTEIVTAYTTFCPTPTIITENGQTYVVTEPTTLTILDCPCTRTHTFVTETVTVCLETHSAAPQESSTPAPVAPSSTVSPHDDTPHVVGAGSNMAANAAAAIAGLALFLL